MAGPPRLRLRTKLVLAITLMMAIVVTTFSSLYLSQLVQHRLDDAEDSARFVSNQVFHATREALELDLSSTRIDPADPQALDAAIAESLQTDPGLNSLLQSIVGYSPTIYDVAIVNTHGVVLMHTDPQVLGKNIRPREDFEAVRSGKIWRQLKVIYGAPKVYELNVPLERSGKPFGEIRVGISTVFVRSELKPQLARGALFSGLAILVSLLLAAGLSNLALRPLTTIGRRLDLITLGSLDSDADAHASNTDEVGQVTTKIDRIGRQMRDVKEVFSALKDNLDQIMANLQDGLMLFTREGKVVLVSASVEPFLGTARDRLLGNSLHEIFPGASDFEETLRASFDARRSLPEREFETASGQRVLTSFDMIEEGGEQIGALLTLRDAERVRRIENDIALSHRLAATGRLVSGVGHEVKNPINAIVVHLEVLKQKLHDIDPDARRHMDVIGSEIHRLDRVVQMLVDFTRPLEMQLVDTDLRRIVEEVLNLAEPDAARHGTTIERQMTGSELSVRIDVDLFKQAVLNVVLNGIQAMSHGGKLRVSTQRTDDHAELLVRDDGPGIPEEIQDKVFNLYFTTKKTGSGIGLAMTYKILQLHNGSVQFESNPRGTTFTVRVPLQASGKELRAQLAATSSGSHPTARKA